MVAVPCLVGTDFFSLIGNCLVTSCFICTGWSDIYGLKMTDREDRNGFDNSAARVNEIIQKEIDGGVSPSKIVVAGFSQGGALALHVALRSAHALGGCVALSTWVPLRADYPASLSATARTLPILQVSSNHYNVHFGSVLLTL